MIVKGLFEFMVVGKRQNESKDGRMFYSLAVVTQDGEASNFGCPQEVYDSVKLMEKGRYIGAYDTRYQTFKIVGIQPATASGK